MYWPKQRCRKKPTELDGFCFSSPGCAVLLAQVDDRPSAGTHIHRGGGGDGGGMLDM